MELFTFIKLDDYFIKRLYIIIGIYYDYEYFLFKIFYFRI